jgi:ribosomal protein S18 acetylase RimI-like enzyme
MTPIDYDIRQMTEHDLPAVAEIEAGVFTDWYRTYRRQNDPLAERTLAELRYATSLDPAGNSVAIASDGALVGFILARTWGKVGWFGTFGVPTQLQGLGIGRALIERTMGHLRENATVVGLETMPESGANVTLYSRAGFAFTYPTVILEVSLIRESERFRGMKPEELFEWGAQGSLAKRKLLREIRDIGNAIVPGLDHTPEVEAIGLHNLGRTLLSVGRGGRLDGFAIFRTVPFRRDDTSGRGFIHILAVRPGADQERVLTDLLRQLWVAATMQGFSKLATGLSGRYQRAFDLLLGNGFRAIRAAVRMVDRTAPVEIFAPSGEIEVSRWAG